MQEQIGGAIAAAVVLGTGGVATAQSNPFPGWQVRHQERLTVYTPSDLKPNEGFSVVSEPPATIDGNLASWVSARVDADAAKMGTLLDRQKPTQSTKNGVTLVTCVVFVQPKSGKEPLMCAYYATGGTGSTARLTRVICTKNKATYSRYLPTVGKAVFALAESSGTETATTASTGTTAPKTKPSSPSDAYRKPGKGIAASQVAGIYSQMTGRTGAGGGLIMVSIPLIAFKDGTFYEDFDVSLADFDVAAARAARPTAWGKWRKTGAGIEATNSKGAWEKAQWIGPLPSAKPGEQLSGTYSTISGGGNTAMGGSVMVVVSSDITFLPNGRFKAGKFAGGGTDQVTAGSESQTDGTYSLSGYTLTLKYKDGRVERKAFAFMDKDGNKDAIHLDGDPFLKD